MKASRHSIRSATLGMTGAIAILVISAAGASAQSSGGSPAGRATTPDMPTGGVKGKTAGAGSGTAAGAAGMNTTNPSAGGVAGTGMGGTTKGAIDNGLGGDMSGTGLSAGPKAGLGLGGTKTEMTAPSGSGDTGMTGGATAPQK